ncbi:MAG: nicotinamide-nucleotide amidohydrolase family protein [Planctomycetaceae bacterium]|nr:nicotinamide-nucleotide amidohydrolase family protein [Planctomycetaceae bacterium]
MIVSNRLCELAHELSALLSRHGCRIAFAESCTAGWLSALLSTIPGISQSLCGSAVVYRELTKHSWLDVSAHDLNDPAIGAVSPEVATQMAMGVLEHTPEADLSAAITGHLGPNAPAHQDGVAFIAVARRTPHECQVVQVRQVQLGTDCPDGISLRWHRQQFAVALVYEAVIQTIPSQFDTSSDDRPTS